MIDMMVSAGISVTIIATEIIVVPEEIVAITEINLLGCRGCLC
jgi:hypothetical protein